MKRRMIFRTLYLCWSFIFIISGCSSAGDAGGEPEKETLLLAVVSGNGQTGAGGHLLVEPLVVRLTDLGDRPVSGITLNFRVVEGEGHIPQGSAQTTDLSGQASVLWMIGSAYNGIEVLIDSDDYRASPVYFWAEGENPRGIHITRTIASFRRVDGVLYEMTFYGDYSRESISAASAETETADFITAVSGDYHCSLFSVFGLNGQFRLGRSFDNPSGWKCLTLITRVNPSDGYASVAPMRMRDIGFSPDIDFDELVFEAKKTLLDTVRFPPDGVNETGLVMGLANVTPQSYVRDPNKQTIHCCLWVRKVLNECRTVDDAIALTHRYNIQSGSSTTLDVHAMVADASGHSIILDPAQGEMKVIRSQGPFQVMTNSPVYQVPLETQKAQCPRFRFIYQWLEEAAGRVDEPGCWNILQEVGNVWTEWSAVYGITARSASLAIDFNFDPLYHFFVFPLW